MIWTIRIDLAAAVLALGLCLSSALVAAPAGDHFDTQTDTALFNALTQLRSEVATDRVDALAQLLSLGQHAWSRTTCLHDSNPNVRIAAMPPLARFADTKVTRAMESVANSDPFTDTRNGENVFPVRLAAEAWLRERGRR